MLIDERPSEGDLGLEYLMDCARRNGALEGDEKALLHLFREAIEMGYWRGVES